MTVSLILRVSGNYVATAKNKSTGQETKVGPGTGENRIAEQSIYFQHGAGPQDYEIDERPATAEEIEAAKA